MALLQDDRLLYEVYLDAGMTHSETLMPMMCRIRSLPDTRGLNLPLSTNLMAEGTLNHAMPVAIPAAMSVEPTPVEKAPSAP